MNGLSATTIWLDDPFAPDDAMPTIPPIPKTPDGYKQYAAAMAQEFHASTTGPCHCGRCDRRDERDPLGTFSDKPVREGWFQIVEAR